MSGDAPEAQAQRIVDEARAEAARILINARERAREMFDTKIHGCASVSLRPTSRAPLTAAECCADLAKHKGRNWQRRFCVLRGSVLLYYHHHLLTAEASPKGALDLMDGRLYVDTSASRSSNPIRSALKNERMMTPFLFSITRPR